MHLMTSHTFQLNFLLFELFPFSDDLDTEECWRLVFSCPKPCSPRTKREMKLPTGQSGDSFCSFSSCSFSFHHGEQP